MRKSIFLFVLIWATHANAQVSSKIYYLKAETPTSSILYIKDIATEHSLANEPIAVTAQRFNAITDVHNFKRTGNGFFKMRIKNQKKSEILFTYFHFTELEIVNNKTDEKDFR